MIVFKLVFTDPPTQNEDLKKSICFSPKPCVWTWDANENNLLFKISMHWTLIT